MATTDSARLQQMDDYTLDGKYRERPTSTVGSSPPIPTTQRRSPRTS
jgi:hypothetical protein